MGSTTRLGLGLAWWAYAAAVLEFFVTLPAAVRRTHSTRDALLAGHLLLLVVIAEAADRPRALDFGPRLPVTASGTRTDGMGIIVS